MNALRQHAEEYLAIRRSLGFKLRGHDRLLTDFCDYLDQTGTATVTAEAALDWATRRADVSPVRWTQRLSAVRGFARHLHALDPSVDVPSVDLLPCRRLRPVPYLYSQGDIDRLVDTAATLRPALRGATYEAFFGLLAVTGMRIGEAIRLDRDDVDLQAGRLEINDTKFGKHRRLPVHASTMHALRRYAQIRGELCPIPKARSFFISTRGTRLLDVCVHDAFRQAVERGGLASSENLSGRRGPRVHGLRHSFAVATLRDWYRSGEDVAGKLPVLSAFLGHVHPASTYWYLQACPDLLDLAAERLERFEAGPR